VIAAGVRFGCVLADAAHGANAKFRNELTVRKLAWAVGIPLHLKVYPADVKMIQPPARKGGGRRRLPLPDSLPITAEDMLAKATWHTISWRGSRHFGSVPILLQKSRNTWRRFFRKKRS
jgi:SRSO17 transposase